MSNTSPEFSFDLNPDLDRELTDIYRRNVEAGLATGEIIENEALAEIVSQQVTAQSRQEELHVKPEILEWAREELDADRDGVLARWSMYDQPNELGMFVPQNVEKFHDKDPNFGLKLENLYQARQKLLADGGVTPEGLKVGETMHLLAIPWQSMRTHLRNFEGWLWNMRQAQSVDEQDYFNDDLLDRIKDPNQPLYRNPNNPASMMIASEYLDQRIAEDGPWGVMLVQTSNEAGLETYVKGPPGNRTPDALTARGTNHFRIAGVNVDAMGIFEWIALSLQEEPEELSGSDFSWLLANRMNINNTPYVPYGNFYDGQVRSYLRDADDYQRPCPSPSRSDRG